MNFPFHKKQQETDTQNSREVVITCLRNMTTKEYEKTIKIVEIYRKADEDAEVVRLGSKKALREQQKEEQSDAELNNITNQLEEVSNE